MLSNLVLKNRSYRRFKQDRKITMDELRSFIDLARLTPSAKNNQVLKYILLNQTDALNKVFPHLAWAGYLKNWPGPNENERPVAYIIVLRDDNISTTHFCDDGIAIQTILLAAVEKELGGCIIGAFDKKKLTEALKIPKQYSPLYVIALGEPSEKIVLQNVENNNTEYWRDEQDVHHVPKRNIDELILTGF